MIASPAVMTPPTVWTLDWNTSAVLRRADVDALELVLGGDLALDELADLAVDLARLLGDLAAQIAVDLDDLQFGLRDLACGLRGLRDQLRGFALQPHRLAFELGQLGERDELLLPQIVDASFSRSISLISFSLDSRCAFRPRTSSLSCSIALAKLRLLADARVAPQLEQLALAVEDRGDVGIVGARQKIGRKFDCARCRRARFRAALCARRVRRGPW